MNSIDKVIVDNYTRFDIPVDQLLVNAAQAHAFVVAVATQTKAPLDDHRVLTRLLTMRKKGMLPRLRRNREVCDDVSEDCADYRPAS